MAFFAGRRVEAVSVSEFDRICADNGVDQRGFVDDQGNALLHIAAFHKNADVLRELLRRGEDAARRVRACSVEVAQGCVTGCSARTPRG